jgi:hypothetical protein
MAEEKEKEKTPGEREIEDMAGPSGNPAANTVPAQEPVKEEEVEATVNLVRYKVVEVLPSELAQLVIEDMLATKGTQPVKTVEEAKAVVEPKPEPVEPVILPVIVPWTDETRKELKITTRKNEAGKEVIKILDSDDEMPDEGKGKEPDTQDGDGNVPDS